MFVNLGVAFLSGFWNGEASNDDECNAEDCHSNEEERRHIGHGCFVSHCTYEGTYQQRSQRSCQRVQGSTCLNELVTFVSTTAKEVQHGVYYSVKHTYAETANESAKQINVDGRALQELEAGEVLDADADEADCQCNQSGLLVTNLDEHLTCRNTHEQISQEVHQVTSHTCPFILVLPNGAKWCGHVGYE